MEPLLRSNHDLNLTHNRNQISNIINTDDFPSQTNLYKVEQITPASYEDQRINGRRTQEHLSEQRYHQFMEHPPIHSQIQTNYRSQSQSQPVKSAVTFSPIGAYPQPQFQPQSHITYPSNYTFNNKSGTLSNQFSASPPQQIFRPQVNFNGSSANRF